MKKRILSMLLALALCAGWAPRVSAFRFILGPVETWPGGFLVRDGNELAGYKGEGGDVVIPDGITTIGHYAFESNKEITSVTIPYGVTTIDTAAFQYCSNLTQVSIPDSVTTIGFTSFANTGLTSVVIPDSVETLEYKAFGDCKNLASVTFGRGLTEIGSSIFEGSGLTEVIIPDTVMSIGIQAFHDCDNLTSVTIPSSVTNIEQSAFSKKGIVFNEDLTVYCEPDSAAAAHAEKWATPVLGSFSEDGTFVPAETEEPVESEKPTGSEQPTESEAPSESEKPTEGEAPSESPNPGESQEPQPTEPEESDFVIDDNGVLTRYQGAATDVVIPDGVTAISSGAFFRDLTSLTIPDSVTEIREHAFSSQAQLKQVKFGKGLTTIETYAFAYCSALTEVIFPDSLKTVGDHAFYECSKLDHVELGNGVTTIGVSSFRECESLTEIIIPENVTHIGHQAFYRSNGALIGIKGVLGGAAEDYIKSTWMCLDTEIFIPGTFVNGEFVTDGKEYDLETYVKQERARVEQEQAIQRAKGREYYQNYLQANRDLIDSIEEYDYVYTWVPDDIQVLSDQLCKGLTSDYDRVLALHDWVTENIYYSYPALKDYTLRHDSIQEAYDNRNCVCVGYSHLMQSLCWAQGIPTVCISGTAGGAHAWNVINIDGEWRWMDATWDTYNRYDGPHSWSEGGTRLHYFLCSTEFISTDHKARCTTVYEGENITTATYYALYYPATHPDITSIGIYDGLDDATVKEINTIRVKAGLSPVTTGTEWGWFCLYYQPPEDNKTEQTQTSAVETSMSSEEKHKQQDEELEKEYQEDMKKYFLNDTSLSPWAKDEVARAIENKLVPQALLAQFNTEITREEFCVLMVHLLTQYSGKDIDTYLTDRSLTRSNPFTDTTNSDVLAAYVLGIVKGMGEGIFNPDGSITRQEAATMLTRTAKELGLTAGNGEIFNDAGQIADWAKESVSFVSALVDPTTRNKVMGGTGEGNFSPLGTYTREQAILTALRLFHCKG